MSMRMVLSSAVSLIGLGAFAALDGALKWKGDPMGGEWCDAANWEVSGTSSYTVEELLAKKTEWNFSTLADGAVVSNNLASVCIGALVIPQSGVTVHLAGTKDITLPKENLIIDINAADSVLEWEQNHANTWAGDTSGYKVITRGAGTVHLNPSTSFNSYKLDFQPCHDTTVVVGPRYYSTLSFFTLWNNAKLKFENGKTIAQLTMGHATTSVDLNGNTLYVGSGEQCFAAPQLIGKILGKGGIVWYGSNPRAFGSESQPADLSGLEGRWLFYDGLMTFPSTVSIPSTLGFSVNGGGEIRLNADTTLTDLRGDGATGTILMKSGTALTLTAPSGTNATYAARISGAADVVKAGAGYDLTLTGDNAYTGATTVAAGSLALKRPFYRKGLVRRWSFDDPDSLGRDYGPYARPAYENGADGYKPFATNGVGGGHAAYFPATSEQKSYFSHNMAQPENGWPVKNQAVSVSLWLKPVSMSGNPTYIYRHGFWGQDGGQFTVWGMDAGKSLIVSLDNWLTTDGPNSPKISTPNLMDGNWHHVAVTYADKVITFWYDGEAKNTKTVTHTLNISSGSTVNIGSNETGKRYVGAIDEVSVWDHALTADEIAADIALARGPANPAELLPEPVCHWAFEDPSNPGKAEKGPDLVAHPLMSTAPAIKGNGTQAGAIHGYVAAYTSAFKLPMADFPANFPTGRVPYTVSVRLSSAGLWEYHSVVLWGDASSATDKFRLWASACPRNYRVTLGNKSDIRFQWTTCNQGPGAGSFVHMVVTVDPVSGVLRLYRDGVQENIQYDYNGTIGEGDLWLNADPTVTQQTYAYLDDVRIYDKALSPYEVQLLSRSLETGAVGPVLPAESPVTVASGATLRIDGEGHAAKSVAGAGAVAIGADSTFLAESWTDFTGSVSGLGTLLLSKATGAAPAVEVATDVAPEDGVLALAADTAAVARVRTTGTVRLPKAGTLKLVDADGKANRWLGKNFKVAECAAYEGPADTSGWTFEPSAEGLALEGAFTFADGALWLRMKGAGTMVLIR